MSEDTIVPFGDGELAITRKPLVHREYCSADCKRIEIDKEKRRIECKDCHQEVDAFDYLFEWALKGDRRMSALKDLDEKLRLRGREIEAMTREYRSIRGKVDRLDRPTRKRVEQAMFDQRYNPHHALRVVPKQEKPA